MSHWPDDFTVTGKHVIAESLTMAHEADLVEAAADGELYRLWYTAIPKPKDVGTEIKRQGNRLNVTE